MHTHEHLFIGNEFVSPSGTGTIDVVSPNTGEVIGRVPDVTAADVDRAVESSRAAFDDGPWPRMPLEERLDALRRLSAAITARAQEIAEITAAQNGSPVNWALQANPIAGAMVLDTYADIAKEHPFTEERTGALGEKVTIRRLPVGVAAGIIPWNVPLYIMCMKLGPAMAAGVPVVLKASPETPLDPYLLADAVLEAGLPPGVVNILAARPEASEHLVRHPGIDKVAFTGSPGVGRRIAALCGDRLARCSLELGGKSAAIVLDDVDLDSSVSTLVDAGILNNGQACAAQTRFLVPESRHDEIVDAVVERMRAMVVGPSTDPDTQVGPMVTARQRDRVESYITKGRDEGATVATGGGRPPDLDSGWFVEPTLFTGVDNSMTIAREEIFGPVLSVIPYRDEDHAVAIANDSEFGLSGSVWASDTAHAADIAARIRTGTVTINHYVFADFRAPFGGFKNSGIGRELGPEGLDEYVELQSVIHELG